MDAERWSAPIVKVYEEVVDEIIVNIARHFPTDESDKHTGTLQWQVKKLSEMGKLRQETVRIISSKTEVVPDLIWEAIEGYAGEMLAPEEELLAKAARDGVLETVEKNMLSPAVVRELNAYSQQAVNQLNLVNTVMLDSAEKSYARVVSGVLEYERITMSEKEAARAQEILNMRTGSVIAGASSHTEAVRRAVKEMADAGMKGFVDRGGHTWSAEAYVAMDIRTTVHNAAIQAQKTRSEEYGVSTFQISSHAGSRPLCAPYQGWICSWDDARGTVKDLNGNKHEVHPISSTTYGEPAGIFGINCGHFPQTFIPGYSIPRYESLTKGEMVENDALYALSQKQRALERNIRYAKREAAISDVMGDKESFAKAALALKKAREKYRTFLAETARTERLDRTYVNGYNRSISGKAVWSARKAEKAEVEKNFINTLKVTKGIQGNVHLTPVKIADIDKFSFDIEHIRQERGRSIDRETAIRWIETARISATVWNGRYERFYSDEGAVYVDLEKKMIRTAYSSEDYSPHTKEMMEILNGHKK